MRLARGIPRVQGLKIALFALGAFTLGAFAVPSAAARAQEPPTGEPTAAQAGEPGLEAGNGLLRVFVDCQLWNCDRTQRFREQITFVEWVQLPQDADVLVLWTGQMAGAGFQYVFDFVGQADDLAEIEDRVTFTSSVTDVDEEVLQGLTRTLAAGLVRYVTLRGDATSLEVRPVSGDALDLRRGAGGGGPGSAGAQDDPWDYWIFNLRVNGDLEREDQVRETAFFFGGSANRTTDEWKIDIGFNGNTNIREFELDDTTTVRNEIDDWGVDLIVVRSINDNWSWGGQVEARTSTRLNQDLRYSFSPAIEWNYFPWQEATRRRFVVLYTNGVQHVDYEQTTVFGKDVETLWVQAIDAEYRAQEPWGNARAGVEFNHILNRSDKYSVELDGRLEYRLFRGLSLNLDASYSIIRDQIYLSGAGLDPDEIFLQQRQLATGSRLAFGFGLSYRFGSIYNSIVNARFPSVR
jgi:hypothetical protein